MQEQEFDIPGLANVRIIPPTHEPDENASAADPAAGDFSVALLKVLKLRSESRFRLWKRDELKVALEELKKAEAKRPKKSGNETVVEIRLAEDYNGDLNDIPDKHPQADGVWLRTDSSFDPDGKLNRFIEVMAHHDYTGDDEPDCDEIIEAIGTALQDTKPVPFQRPNSGWFTKLCMSIMPPAPKRHIVFGFGDLKPRFKWYHYAAAVPLFIVFVGLLYGQIALVPFMRYSVFTGFSAAGNALGMPFWLQVVAVAAIYFLSKFVSGGIQAYQESKGKKPPAGSTVSTNNIGFLSSAAVAEEQIWREGSENWTSWQRIRSCVSFGLIHLANLIYSLATVLPLAIGGALFMWVYLRTYRRTGSRRAAVLESSLWHRVYNKIAFIAAGIQLFGVLIFEVLKLAHVPIPGIQ